MFNSPRPSPATAAANGAAGLGASYFNDDPLAGSSVYDSGDPWSNAPTPPPPAAPSFGFLSSETNLPPLYKKAFLLVDVNNTGEASVSALHRVIGTSALPATTIDRIVKLVSDQPRVSRMAFYTALALVALAQSGEGALNPTPESQLICGLALVLPKLMQLCFANEDLSIEKVASLASSGALPVPKLDLSTVAASAFNSALTAPLARSPPPVVYSAEDPWSMANQNMAPTSSVGATLQGSGLPPDWWKRQERVRVLVHGQLGFILKRYTVYSVHSERGGAVLRRYSEFSFLWDCLVRRYPFRIIPALPPKRIGPDETFLENRRKGLARFINFVTNHPVMKDDGLLAVFLIEPSFENWRKHSAINLDEESASKRVDRLEEMAIPSDLEDKLGVVRGKLGSIIEQWQRICLLAERLVKRREAAAADITRLTIAANALTEGLDRASGQLQGYATSLEQRALQIASTTLESLKSQRDLYMAMRDLFIRYDRLSIDYVERLKKRVDTFALRLEGVNAAKKDGWALEADRIAQSIEQDKAAITAQLGRRVFIKHCMWHELRVVMHNRENTLLAEALQGFAGEERAFADVSLGAWTGFGDVVDSMPLE